MKNHVAFLLLLLTVFLTAFSSVRAEPVLKKVSLVLDWYPEAENAGYYYALIHGFYRQAGIEDVRIDPVAANSSVEPEVALDKYDFGLGSSDQVLIGRSRGVPLVLVMGSLQHDPTGVMVHAESPVHTFADLNGHSVAAEPGVPWVQYVVKKYGLNDLKVMPLSFNYAPFLHDPGYIQQVFVTSEPPIMEHKGVKVRTLWVKETGCDPYLGLDSSERFVAEHPATVRAFIQATIAGWRGYMTDPVSTDQEIMRRNPEMDQLQLTLSRQAMLDYHLIDGAGNEIGKVDPARVANQYKILRDLKIIPADFDYQKSYATQFCTP
jgi:NitT/TauT family transport system substrate-binding protein